MSQEATAIDIKMQNFTLEDAVKQFVYQTWTS